jgi:hypothetical protein
MSVVVGSRLTAIQAFQRSLDLNSEADAFQYFALSKILKIDDDEIRTAITDGGDDRGIDAGYIDKRPERRVTDFSASQCLMVYVASNCVCAMLPAPSARVFCILKG